MAQIKLQFGKKTFAPLEIPSRTQNPLLRTTGPWIPDKTADNRLDYFLILLQNRLIVDYSSFFAQAKILVNFDLSGLFSAVGDRQEARGF